MRTRAAPGEVGFATDLPNASPTEMRASPSPWV